MSNRRQIIKAGGLMLAGSVLPVSMIELSFAGANRGTGRGQAGDKFTFAYISDSHIQQIKGKEFVRNWDRGLIRAVAETNLMDPKPDFVVYGGDIAQLALPAEIDHGAELMSKLDFQTYWVMGEHDYYLDDGAYWSRLFGEQYYSFNHKGVHFVVLNSILTSDEWYNKWSSGVERMGVMAGLDDPRGSPFMVGERQREWLRRDLAAVDKNTPLVVFSHSPLQKLFKNWNFWTDDAEQVQALLKPFKKVNVFYGHVHQIQYNQIGNISFHSAMATAWPWPYPKSYAQAKNFMPKLTVEMNRADPFLERDATGWQFIDLDTGDAAASMHYSLTDNRRRTVAFNRKSGRPEDTVYQARNARIAAQDHY